MASLIPWKRSNVQNEVATRSSAPLSRLRWDMDQMFDRFLEDIRGDRPQFGLPSSSGLSIDLTESDEWVRVRAELPGIDADDLDISLTGDVLTLSGEKRDEFEAEEGTRTYSERRFGSFRRSIQLPCPVDPDAVAAEHQNGILTVTLTKSEVTRPRRIEVKSQ